MKKPEKLQLEADPGSIDYSDERYMTVQNLFKIENKTNQLIDLVYSQQEAIGELQTEIGVLRNMVLPLEPADDKPDTHRTVTLRIPKGMTIGKAVWNTLDQQDENCLYRLFEQSDTDLQKALNEVKGESNE